MVSIMFPIQTRGKECKKLDLQNPYASNKDLAQVAFAV